MTTRDEIEEMTRATQARREQARLDRDAGLATTRATLAELWRRHEDPAQRATCKLALEAVIMAERTMRDAVAFVSASTPRERSTTYERLCTSSLVENPRKKP